MQILILPTLDARCILHALEHVAAIVLQTQVSGYQIWIHI